ncbi:hypothetical protein RAB80_014659 [Fusarium oxysporum f. sp. vasinfectum]|nr:hypothetical protein RAB80_014659 [Fusarium oxysporum f. sp. vasinfectum]
MSAIIAALATTAESRRFLKGLSQDLAKLTGRYAVHHNTEIQGYSRVNSISMTKLDDIVMFLATASITFPAQDKP